jgi:hypothetical protein
VSRVLGSVAERAGCLIGEKEGIVVVGVARVSVGRAG